MFKSATVKNRNQDRTSDQRVTVSAARPTSKTKTKQNKTQHSSHCFNRNHFDRALFACEIAKFARSGTQHGDH